MPPWIDEAQFHQALLFKATPALERLAEDSGLRDRALRRFDRSEPPAYESSTDEEDCIVHPALGLAGDSMLDEFKDLMEGPLSDAEQFEVATCLHLERTYNPGERYRIEARIEKARIDSFIWGPSDDMATYLRSPEWIGRAGRERINIIVRRNIKRRWQKLGVWNPQWGIPGRLNNSQSNDDAFKWKWRWQHGDAAAEWALPDGKGLNQQHPIRRAVYLRQDLRRHEISPVPPRSRLQDDVSASQAESFIISRPWFRYDLEVYEEGCRMDRIPIQRQWHYLEPNSKHVDERWKSRGDWKEDWIYPFTEKHIPGWKWRHETPSPGPEDLTCLNTNDMEFTPSEVDALEAVPPPTPPPERLYLPPGDPRLGPGTGLFARPLLVPSGSTDKPEAVRSEQSLLPRQRRRQHTCVDPTQPLRRSARIAAIKAKLSPPSKAGRSITPPIPAGPLANKSKLRGGHLREANRSAVLKASAQPKRKAMGATKRPRGRPKKKKGPK